MWWRFKLPLRKHCEIRKESQKYGLAKIVKKFIFSKMRFALPVD